MENKNWYTLQSTEAAEILKTDLSKGLSSEVAQQRLNEFGYNELEGKKGPTLLEMFLSQFKDFLVLILIAASLVSILIGEVVDSVVIISIVILNAILGVVQEFKANKALDALKKMAAPEAKVIRDSTVRVIPARELVPGDVVLLEAGNYVPADLRLLESVNLKIDESALTGESVPVEKNAEKIFSGEVPLGDRANCAFMGTVVTYGRGKGLVISTGMRTEIGLIAKMLETYQEELTPLQKKLEQTGKTLGIACLVICGVVFTMGLLRGIPFLEMFMTAISLAVAAIPEGLPAIVTIVLALGLQRMVKRNAIIKKLHAVETLGSTTVICSDKTGTLTQNQMTATKIFTDGQFISITGEGYKPFGEFYINDTKIDPKSNPSLELLLKIGALCNDAKLEEISQEQEQKGWRIIGDPTEGALVVAAAKAGLLVEELDKKEPRLKEIPFDSDRKLMTTIHPSNGKYVAYVKGAPDVLLSRSAYIFKDGKVMPLGPEDIETIASANKKMASQALRVLALAYRLLDILPDEPKSDDIEKELVFVGLIGMIDPPRPEAIEAIKVCKQAGIRPVMITGDHRDTAVAIAKQLGLIDNESGVLTGAELDSLTDEELLQKSKEVAVYARVSPVHKLRIVDAIKSNGHIAAMTGDGVNDAPALKKADIGVAMGITGTDVAKETADMILVDDNFASIVAAVEEGRVIYSNIRKFIFFLLSCNIAEILIIFVSMLAGLPIPLKPIQLLWINILTDAFPALALGVEKKEPDIMQRPPRKPEEPIIDRRMRWQIAIQSIFMTLSTLGVFVFALETTADLQKARTFAFTTLIFSELLRAYTSRSETYSVFKIGLFTNRFMVLGSLISLALLFAVIYIPFLRTIFDTTYLTFTEMDIVILFGLIPFTAAEISKIFLRKTKA